MKFSVQYNTEWGESLRLVSRKGISPLSWNEGNIWSADISKGEIGESYHYELVREGIMIRRENGEHATSSSDGHDRWIEWPVKRGAGTAVPVFSLRSVKDFGIGEFLDLKLLVDWAEATGQKIIQLLPVNDTTRKGEWKDSYPYSPISSFALHPLYINLQTLGIEEDEQFVRTRDELNALEELDYPRVFREKMEYLHKAYKMRGDDDLRSREYKKFYAANSSWLQEYAEFCSRRDFFDEDFYKWTQFHLDRQFSETVAYARSKEIVFKGDLPIGVSGDSADAFFHPELFNLDGSAGAPPDFFSSEGQNWGFPTYNWENMEKDRYAWWKARLRKMNEYFDAFRIDHILGWFRIWEIPPGCTGKYGHFNPALPYCKAELESRGLPVTEKLFTEDPHRKGWFHPLISPDTSSLEEWQKNSFDSLWEDFFFHRHENFWKESALKKIPELLGATPMLACGEDLGMVPACVPEVMERFRILSLELPKMEKGRPWPYLSVCSTSTHDMEPLRCSEGGDLPEEECRERIRAVLSSDSMLAILPLQDWMSMDSSLRRENAGEERINEPSNASHHWRWRMHVTLESLCNKKDGTKLGAVIRELIESSGRAE